MSFVKTAYPNLNDNGILHGPDLRILVVSAGFPPVSHSGTLRITAFAKYLPECGINPIVLTQPTEHGKQSGVTATKDEPVPACCVIRTVWNPEQVHPMFLTKLIARIPGGSSLLAVQRNRSQSRRIIESTIAELRAMHPSAVLASSPPSDTLFIGAALSEELGVPFIADMRDLWTYVSHYRHLIDYQLASVREKRIFRMASRVLVTTASAQSVLVQYLGIQRDKVILIPNGYDEDDFSHVNVPAGRSPYFVITHAGQLSLTAPTRSTLLDVGWRWLGFSYCRTSPDYSLRSPQVLLEAAMRLLDRRPDLRDVLKLQFIGCEDANAECFRRFPYPDSLLVESRVPIREANQRIAESQLLILMQNEYRLRGSSICLAIPGKTYSYLRSGKRILALTEQPEIAALITENQAGVVVSPRDADSIAAAIESEIALAANGCVPNASRIGIHAYDRRVLTSQLARVVRDVCHTQSIATARSCPAKSSHSSSLQA